MSGQIGGNDLRNKDDGYRISADDASGRERPQGSLKRSHVRRRLVVTFGDCLHPGAMP